MSISIGDKAPDFTLPSKTADGPQLWTLSEATADQNVLVLFFPMAFTGVCTDEFCSVSQGLDAYSDLKATVVGVSGDNPFSQEAWAQKEGITVPLLSDYEHEVAKAYGVAYDQFVPAANLTMGGVPKRSAFIVDKAGIVQYAESSDDPKQLPDFEAIKAKLGELT